MMWKPRPGLLRCNRQPVVIAHLEIELRAAGAPRLEVIDRYGVGGARHECGNLRFVIVDANIETLATGDMLEVDLDPHQVSAGVHPGRRIDRIEDVVRNLDLDRRNTV